MLAKATFQALKNVRADLFASKLAPTSYKNVTLITPSFFSEISYDLFRSRF
ncbi:hypothetical protein [Pseudomonas sp. DSP3-2-2]|uniref:hypothetical protein n=1 Tax=unclassified Pseudomonas TaxID=196821 RepID=UPI003CF6ECF2